MHKAEPDLSGKLFTEDRHGLKAVHDILGQMGVKSTPVPEGFKAEAAQDGQVMSDGTATLTYDEGQCGWVLDAGDAPAPKIVSLLSSLAVRLQSRADMGQLPTKVSPLPESADISIVPNDFG